MLTLGGDAEVVVTVVGEGGGHIVWGRYQLSMLELEHASKN